MTKNVLVCRPQSDVAQVEALMQRSQVRRIPVVDGRDELVGIVSLNDLAQEAERERQKEVQTPDVSLSEVAITLGAVGRPRRSFNYATV